MQNFSKMRFLSTGSNPLMSTFAPPKKSEKKVEKKIEKGSHVMDDDKCVFNERK